MPDIIVRGDGVAPKETFGHPGALEASGSAPSIPQRRPHGRRNAGGNRLRSIPDPTDEPVDQDRHPKGGRELNAKERDPPAEVATDGKQHLIAPRGNDMRVGRALEMTAH